LFARIFLPEIEESWKMRGTKRLKDKKVNFSGENFAGGERK
jgi:hypothetical protein